MSGMTPVGMPATGVRHQAVPPEVFATPAQEALNRRVLALLADVDFRPRRECDPYQFNYDVRRQLLMGSHYTNGRWWNTRKWFISEHATDSEILQTVLKLCLTSVEHEAREHFTYQRRAIYGPHLSKERLWEMAGETEEREEILR